MSKIDSMEKALEYFTMNQKGNISKLNTISDDLILKIIESGFLTMSNEANEEYTFSQEGVDFYCSEYGINKKVNFLGL